MNVKYQSITLPFCNITVVQSSTTPHGNNTERVPRDGFSDLVDLWVIKIKKPMILCARSTSRSREQNAKRRSRSENKRKACLSYSQNNKIVSLSNMADKFLEKFTRCAKVPGLFFLIVLFGCWLAEQENTNHVVLARWDSVYMVTSQDNTYQCCSRHFLCKQKAYMCRLYICAW